MAYRAKIVNEAPASIKNNENVEISVPKGQTCNVFEQEMTWKILNYIPKKAYSVSFLLPRAIECTLGLYPSMKLVWRNEHDGSRREFPFFYVNPILFFNKIPNQRDHYKFKLKISQAAKTRGVFGTTFYETASLRPQGFNGYGHLISSENCRNYIDRDGHLTLDLTFILKEVEHCKPFDREDYTIERSIVAKDMTKLFLSEDFSDVTIVLGDDKIRAHKMVLAAHSNAMAKMIEDTSELKINMRAPKEAYIELLRFVYNNTVKDLKKNLEYLLMLAKEFEVEGLRILCLLEINRAVRIKYNKFIGKNPKVPPTIMENDEKAIKFYKLLYDMDELFYDKQDYPTPSSSKSSLDDEQPNEQSTEAEVLIQDIQLPTIVLHPPPTFEPDINDEILSTSMTKFFVDIMSPIVEQDEEIIVTSSTSEKRDEELTATPIENEETVVEADEEKFKEVSDEISKNVAEDKNGNEKVSPVPTKNAEIVEVQEEKSEDVSSVEKGHSDDASTPTESQELVDVEIKAVSSIETKEEVPEVAITEIAVEAEKEKSEVVSSVEKGPEEEIAPQDESEEIVVEAVSSVEKSETAETKEDKLEVIYSAKESQTFEVDSETSEEEIPEEKKETSVEEKDPKPANNLEAAEIVEPQKEIQIPAEVVTQTQEKA